MSKRFSLFEKDGLKISGDHPEDPFANIAKKITNGYMSLYFRSSSTSIIIGSCFNLKRSSGGREEGFIVIGEYSSDDLNKISSFDFLQNYFHDSIEFINQSGYTVLDLYGEQKIKDVTFKIPQTDIKKKELAKTISGKLLFSKDSFVCSKDLINSLSFFGFLLENLKPVLYTEFTFVISKLIVPADLIICSNRHPDESKIDIDIDSNSFYISHENNVHYKQLVEFLPKISLKSLPINKKDIVRLIIPAIVQSERDEKKREEIGIDWTLYLFNKYPGGNIVKLDVKTAINQLFKGRREYFQVFINSNYYLKEEFESVLRSEYLPDDIAKIRTSAMLVDHYPTPEIKDEIDTILEKIKKEKTFVVPKISPKLKYATDELDDMLYPPSMDYRRVAIFIGIFFLILAIIAAIVFFNPLKIALPTIAIPGIINANESAQNNDSMIDHLINQSRSTPTLFPAYCVNRADFKYPQCDYPSCCVIESSDTKARLYVDTSATTDTTKISIDPHDVSVNPGSIFYQSTNYSLQDKKSYFVRIENLQISPKRSPTLIISVDNSDNYRKNFISKLNNNVWEFPTTVKPAGVGGSNSRYLDINADGIYGLFIEDL